MTNLQYLQQARRDLIRVGPKGHYACEASHPSGESDDGRLCAGRRALLTYGGIFDGHYLWLLEQWQQRIGETLMETNERGYAAVVAAYDTLILFHTPSQTTIDTYPQEVVPA